MVFYNDLKDQQLLLPLNIRDLIPDNHICFLVDEIIQNLDLSEFERKYEGAGHPAYPPKLLLKLLILGMTDGIRSSRKVAKGARENVVYMYLSGLLKPDFRTISDFRKNNPELVFLSFQEIVKYSRELGMITLGQICIDGTKIKANASRDSAVKKEDILELKELIQKEIEEGIKVDEEDDEIYGDKNIDELPDNVNRKTIIERVRKKYKSGNKTEKDRIKTQIQKVEKEMETAENAISLTDPECRFMQNNKKVIEYSYNPQIVVDSSWGIIISSDVTPEVVYRDQLRPQIKHAEENVGEFQDGTKIIADNGYYSSKNLKFLKSRGLNGYIPDLDRSIEFKWNKVNEKNAFSKANFRYNPDDDCYICPNNKKLTFRFEYLDINVNRNIRIFKGTHCKQCPDLKNCGKNSRDGRVIKDYEGMELERIRMKEKMSSVEGIRIYQTRKEIIEHIFGHIKANLGFREFLLRGIKAVKIEFNLACIASNLRRIWSYLNGCKAEIGVVAC